MAYAHSERRDAASTKIVIAGGFGVGFPAGHDGGVVWDGGAVVVFGFPVERFWGHGVTGHAHIR